MKCEHHKRIGDNYGVTCQDCKEVLEGYGYGGWFGSNLNMNDREYLAASQKVSCKP